MHEASLAAQILETAEEHAREQGAVKVTAIHLVVGGDAGCDAGSLELYFEILSEGSLCEGARLEVEPVVPLLRCNACGKLFARKPFSFACPEPGCPGEGEPTEIGREFYIRSIEVIT